jgi:hypothetical protein
MGGGQDACQSGIGGYHESTAVNGNQVAYGVIPQCNQNSLDDSTLSASHEFAEAVVDPHPDSNPGWVGYDDKHLAWEFFQQGQSENGDMCEFYRDSFYRSTSTDLPFAVQRTWSNASAAAGHNPCVPAPQSAYFNVVPLGQEDIELDLSALNTGDPNAAHTKTKGYHIAVGETKTIDLGFYSDVATSGDWTIKAVEGGIQGTSQKGKVTMSLDVNSGRNGNKAILSVKVNIQGKTKGELITIVSTLNGTSHYMPIMIGSM